MNSLTASLAACMAAEDSDDTILNVCYSVKAGDGNRNSGLYIFGTR